MVNMTIDPRALLQRKTSIFKPFHDRGGCFVGNVLVPKLGCNQYINIEPFKGMSRHNSPNLHPPCSVDNAPYLGLTRVALQLNAERLLQGAIFGLVFHPVDSRSQGFILKENSQQVPRVKTR